MTDLSGKIAIITGAASGIGLAGVETFVKAGAKVIAGDVQDEKGKALETRFGADTVRYIHCDVTDMGELEALMQSAVDAFGGLDILWNNAGAGGTPTDIEDLDLDGYDFTMNLLLKQVFAGTKFAIPHMKARGKGAIINTSSISAVCAGYAPITYSVAKKGVAHFSKLAAAQLAKYQIRVNAILPGFIATSIFGGALGMTREQSDQMAEMLAQAGGKMQPIGRVGRGGDIAEMAAFLASDAAGFVTGGEFLVDGGMTVGPPHSWNEEVASPILDALGITPEQAEQMRVAMASGSQS
ncbi:SDR family NAD(P)-dependent oxidoreductase [Hyphomonas johnsonii]|jgi:NAD(P)-dependent dehydrogenase (short-subunit alcohol dehydrogenase family)|uniref:Short chain dehydrogenase/reductase family oxidoreductase n=1 Tax=Hyphomonas johnsonii MHS-2 TaxID=1280950 RepID=A0A059FMJ6_9PROT|nr:SDR family NAD(P)-dependent oxidoreductase [Hyphomonas johnsonii]KCZ91683.1 short chain dehydrogenase/reductase family oxidoreductase [Hyphomonas johnsonii MHS-2]